MEDKGIVTFRSQGGGITTSATPLSGSKKSCSPTAKSIGSSADTTPIATCEPVTFLPSVGDFPLLYTVYYVPNPRPSALSEEIKNMSQGRSNSDLENDKHAARELRWHLNQANAFARRLAQRGYKFGVAYSVHDARFNANYMTIYRNEREDI